MTVCLRKYGSTETDNGSSGYSAKGACGAETSAEINSGETLDELNIKNPVYLVKRDSVRE